MEKIVINKEFLKGYQSIWLGFENCDVYEVAIEDVLDIYCEAEQTDKKKNTYRTGDGFIKISARASQTIEVGIARNNEIGTEFDYRLRERLEMCNGCADITSFDLRKKKKSEMEIVVPYDALEDIRGSEIEWSNCPSLEVDEEGNMIIAFGESSKQPRRKDNNYHELVQGWKEAFGDYRPEVLEIKSECLLTFGKGKMCVSLAFEFCDKNVKEKSAELVFMNCEDLDMEIYFDAKGETDIVMSKMADGRIYVGAYCLGVQFICESVLEYQYYCKQLDENEQE